MFKLHRHRSDRLGDKLEFRFSNLQAFKIPRGWDKLVLSIISVETGKVVAKSAKATVRSGTCQWTDAESIWVCQDEASSELEESQFKIVISMGSSRSGILGEVILNLENYLSSEDSAPLLLPLDYCEPGSALQVKIQCFAAKSKFRVGKSLRERTSHIDDLNSNYDDMNNKSDGSNPLFNKNISSTSTNQFGGTLIDEHGNKDTTRSTSGSHLSFDSGDGSFGKSNFNGGSYVGRQDSAGSHVSANSNAGPGEELSKSNPSSFNSRASGSSFHNNQWQEVSQASHGLAPLEIGPSDSSKALLEAAEELEELHDEVKMWERHARQLKVDIEMLKKELSEKSNNLANLDAELSTACNERDSLKQEVQRLQLLAMESSTQKTHTYTSRDDNSINMLKELENEVKFQKESNASLMLQLKKSQESNLELVAILQELEDTIEKTKHHMDLDMELSAAYNERDSLKQEVEQLQLALEESMKKKTHTDTGNENSARMLKELEDEMQVQKETNANLMLQLKKSQESNIELVSILQELEDTVEKSKNLMVLDMELSAAYNERDNLKREVERLQLALEESMEKQTQIDTSRSEYDVNMLKQLEDEVNSQKESNANLILQLKKSQTSNVELVAILQELEDTVEKQALEIANLTEKNNEFEDKGNTENRTVLLQSEVEWERKLSIKEREIANLQEKLSKTLNSQPTNDLARNGSHSDNIEEIEALRTKIQELERDCLELTDENLDLLYKLKELSGDKGSHYSPSSEFDSNILHHNFGPDIVFLQSKKDEPKEVLEKGNVVVVPSSVKPRNFENLFHDLELQLKHSRDEANDLQIKLQKAQVELEEKNLELFELRQKMGGIKDSDIQSYMEELDRSQASFEEIKSQLLLKQQETDSLMSSKKEQEDVILDLQKEKSQLEDNLSVLHRENSFTSKCLGDVQQNLMVVTGNLESQMSANKVLEEKSLELENHIKELNFQIYELEQEKLQLSEGISALEAEVKNLENDKEFNRLELEDSKSLILNMKVEIEKCKHEMETQKTYLEQKLHETEKQLQELQEESETLRQSNSKLQVTIQSLDEECDSLQRLNGDLKRQQLEVHEHAIHLEAKLEDTQSRSLRYSTQVELLEEEISSLQKKTFSKEKSLLLQIDQIIEEHKEHEDNIILARTLLKKMESEKKAEVENLEREIAELMAQMSSTQDEREKIASDAILEASILRSDKAKLEYSLNELTAKVESYETDLLTLRQDSKVKIDGLVELLNASKHSEEMLMADIQDMQKLVNDAKSSEENSRNFAAEIEIKLKMSDYEKQQMAEEMSISNIQLEKMSKLQDEILLLKGSLDDEKIEKEKLEGFLRSSSEECEQLKMERESLMERLTSMQQALDTEKGDTQSRIALQEKLLRLENDLSAKEASNVYDAEMINEIKRANIDYQRKIQCLEDEKQELTKKAELIEKELMLKKEVNNYEQDNKVNAKLQDEEEESHISKADGESKIHTLQQKLAEALATNNVYKEQLDKFLVEKQADNPEVCKKPSENEASIDNTSKTSSLEAELKEMKERYLHMSLQYAEVEAQREELVLQLKSLNKGKRWFS